MAGEFRHQLQARTASAAAPYGFTLTIWGSGMVTVDALGHPGLLRVLLFVAGAVAAFVLVEAAASGSLRIRPAPPAKRPMAVWGNAHWVSAGGAIVAVDGVDHLVEAAGGWAAAGFVATAAYLLVNALQATLASRAHEEL